MNIKRFGIFVALLAVVVSMQAQRAASLRINEVLVINENNFQDDYGQHNAWIEIFNTAFASVDIKGCFLTDDPNNPTKYPIPKSDVLTKIPPRQHVLFWADGMPNRGTFHVSFTLDPTKEIYLALYDSNGKTLIDEVTIPAGQVADRSYAREVDGGDKWVVKGGGANSYVTPSTNNRTIDKNEKLERLQEQDEIGIGMAITAMTVVFSGLLLLYLVFKLVGNTSVKLSKRNAMKVQGITDHKEAKEIGLGQRPGEVFAAIAMAMHEFQDDVHDVENTILTINRVKRTYSPWSSKIYTLRDTPNKK